MKYQIIKLEDLIIIDQIKKEFLKLTTNKDIYQIKRNFTVLNLTKKNL